MFEKRVIPGKTYCITAYCPTVVSSILNNTEVILAAITKPGQYFFVAPTTSVTSSISPNYIIEVKGSGGGAGNSGESGGVGISFEKVADFNSLPETGKLGTIYLVPNDDTENQWTEYVYIDDRYEIIGSKEFTMPDMSQYANLNTENTFTKAVTINNSLIYKGQELTDILDNTKTELEATFVKLEGGNDISGNQVITGDLTITEDSESSGFPGQPYFFDTPSEMLCDVVYDLGVLNENKDLSGIQFANISTHVQTCEIWFETGETTYTVTWPATSIWPDEIGGIAPAGLMSNTAYRYAVRREPNGSFVIAKAYSYPV